MIAKPVVVAVTPLEPGAPAELADVTVTGPLETQNVGQRTAVAKFEVRSGRPLNALLALQAAAGPGGVRQVAYEIVFGAGAPADPGNIESPDLTDLQSPNVARTLPSKGGTIGAGDPILIF